MLVNQVSDRIAGCVVALVVSPPIVLRAHVPSFHPSPACREKGARYENGYSSESPIIKHFWKVRFMSHAGNRVARYPLHLKLSVGSLYLLLSRQSISACGCTPSEMNSVHLCASCACQIVHGLTEEEKRNLLSFVTGSDRVPVKGLGSLPFVIARNGTRFCQCCRIALHFWQVLE